MDAYLAGPQGTAIGHNFRKSQKSLHFLQIDA